MLLLQAGAAGAPGAAAGMSQAESECEAIRFDCPPPAWCVCGVRGLGERGVSLDSIDGSCDLSSECTHACSSSTHSKMCAAPPLSIEVLQKKAITPPPEAELGDGDGSDMAGHEGRGR